MKNELDEIIALVNTLGVRQQLIKIRAQLTVMEQLLREYDPHLFSEYSDRTNTLLKSDQEYQGLLLTLHQLQDKLGASFDQSDESL